MKNNIERIRHIFFNFKLDYVILLLSIFIINYCFLGYHFLKGYTTQISIYEPFWILCFILSIVLFSISLSYYFSKKFFLKFTIGYGFYIFISYIIYAARNVNNPEFIPYNLIKNGLIEYRFFSVLTIILCISVITHYLFKETGIKSKFNLVGNFESKENYLLSLIIASFAVNDTKLIRNLSSNFNAFLEDGLFSNFFQIFALSTFIVLVGTLVICYFLYKALSDIKRNRPTLELIFISSAFWSVIFNYAIQYGIKTDEALFGQYIFPGGTLYQILILFLVYISVYLLFNRYLYSTIFIALSGVGVSIANYIKSNMRNEPLLVTDFSWLKQFKLILSFIDSKIAILLFLSIAISIVAILVLRKRWFPGRIISSINQRLILGTAVASIFLSIYLVFVNEENKRVIEGVPVVSKVNNWLDIAYMGHMTNARYKSLMYVWTKQLTKPIMEKPEDYNADKINALVEKYSKRAEEINRERSEEISDRTVIYILSESLADPARIPSITLSKDIMPNIRSVISKNTGGLMKSDGYGGGTANMENQSLLSLPYYNLSSAVSVMNTEVVPKMTFLPSISNLFESENRIAIHLGGSATYSRKDFYNRLKFEKFIATEGTDDKPDYINEVGLYPSDEATYKNILLNIDESKSQFFSVITYQNHIPWLYGEPDDVYGRGDGLTDAQNSELSNYARLVYQTDIVTKDFLDDLSKLEKDVTVVFYGDHLPGLYPDSLFSENPELQYQAEYFIWSNHETNKLEYNYVNSSDFTAALLAHTNSKVTPYYALMTDVLNQASVNQDELTIEGKEIAEDLKLVQYDLMAGSKFLVQNDAFFRTIR